MNRLSLLLLAALLPVSCETPPSPQNAPGASPSPAPAGTGTAEAAGEKEKALFAACSSLDYTAVRLLLLQGANPSTRNADGRTPLMVLARTEPPDLGQEDEPEWDEDGTGLDYQTSPHFFILRELHSSHADLNARDNDGRTALMHAAHADYGNLATALIRLGADPSLKDNQGNTALNIAETGRCAEAAEAISKATP